MKRSALLFVIGVLDLMRKRRAPNWLAVAAISDQAVGARRHRITCS